MFADSKFSYECNRCGLCCRDKVIALSPYDVIRIARAAGISTGETVARYTMRRGSLLRFSTDGRCGALEDARCTIHSGRPLACRLYPLGLQRITRAAGAGFTYSFIRLEPSAGSLGIYGTAGSIGDFLETQGAGPHLDGASVYSPLIANFRRRVDALVDFECVEPREFWRIAAREALAETNYDPNPLIDALFDPDRLGCRRGSAADTAIAHAAALDRLASSERDGAAAAAAAIMLATSLGYGPQHAIGIGASARSALYP
jgi:Fe-S-cluster containining protein